MVIDSPSPSDGPDLSLRQRALLLDQIDRAAGKKLSQGAANKALRSAARNLLGLSPATANRIRAELVFDGYLEAERTKRVPYYSLTDEGRAYLEQHRAEIAVYLARPVGEFKPPSNDRVRQLRKSYLLLQLLKAYPSSLRQGEANRLDTLGKDRLELNPATVHHLRHELAAQGLLNVTPHGRSESYTLTSAGRLELGTCTFDDDFPYRLKGQVLNELLEAARDAAKQFTAAPPPSAVPTAADLEGTIRAVFEELLRERHAVTGMVPIHEVRAAIRQQLGDPVARHDTFDDAVLRLRQIGQLRMVPITDLSKASTDQLQASIPGIGETLFFLEAAREPVAR